MAPTTSPTSPASLDDLAWAISFDGIAAHDAEVREVAAAARQAGVRPVAASVLADDNLPAPVRERAFGLVAMALAKVRPATATFAVAA
ncbi:MAG: hypothetical protein ABIR68_07110 [Ilumatobacteraceae bacterium]